MTRPLAAVLALTMSGCGLTMTTGPDPHRPPDQRPVCTETMDAPKRDGIGAVLGFVAVVVGAALLSTDDEGNQDAGAVALAGGLVTMAVAYGSGYVGYRRVKQCQKAIDAFETTG